MSWVISIDESGNLGRDTRFFTIAATIIRRPRHLKKVYEIIPKTGIESKYYNTSKDVIKTILEEFAKSDAKIAYVVVDKYNNKGVHYRKAGNNLYRAVLCELFSIIAGYLPKSELEIILDKNSFISLNDANNLANQMVKEQRCTVGRFEKKDSGQSPCLQIADYIAGAVFHHYEYDEKTPFDLIEQKVVVARKD